MSDRIHEIEGALNHLDDAQLADLERRWLQDWTPAATRPICKADVGRLIVSVIQTRRELAEMRASFQLRYDADMRAIQRWQAAHPGSDLIWPDHADMVVWLLEQLAAADKHLTSLWGPRREQQT